MKRGRDTQQGVQDLDLERSIAIANYLLMLSHGPTLVTTCQTSRVFECKTCNRQFPSFQALGGHRASHKKPKLSSSLDHDHHESDHDRTGERGRVKPKTHECSICGLEFGVGQALGGHMRRHRAALTGSHLTTNSLPFVGLPLLINNNKSGNYGYNMGYCEGMEKNRPSLDLNLTPLENGLLEIKTVSSIFS